MGVSPFIGSHFHFIPSLICFISIDGSNSLYSNIIQFVDLIHVHYLYWSDVIENTPKLSNIAKEFT
jgi:hypothetical protein